MKYSNLTNLFWDAINEIVGNEVSGEPDRYIRWKYPAKGGPDWGFDDNIVFLNLSEMDDEYGKQNDSIYVTENDTVIRKRGRTRVWELLCTIYGPESYDIANQIKDGVFTEKVRRTLSQGGVFLVPDMPVCRYVPELYAGRWWNRYDVALHFNEWYEAPDEDVGHIESLTVNTSVHN